MACQGNVCLIPEIVKTYSWNLFHWGVFTTSALLRALSQSSTPGADQPTRPQLHRQLDSGPRPSVGACEEQVGTLVPHTK